MTTMLDLIHGARTAWLTSALAQLTNRLEANLAIDGEEITLKYPMPVGENLKLAIGSEALQVMNASSSTNRHAVMRGLHGTTAAAHTAGAEVEINPAFPVWLLLADAIDELHSWPTRTAAIDEALVSPLDGTLTVTDVGIRNVIAVERKNSYDARWTRVEAWRSFVALDATTVAVYLNDVVTADYRVTYAKDFVLDEISLDTDVADLGLRPQLFDPLKLGIAARALEGEGVRRLQLNAQGASRDAGEVRELMHSRAASALRALRDDRLKVESERIYNLYGFSA